MGYHLGKGFRFDQGDCWFGWIGGVSSRDQWCHTGSRCNHSLGGRFRTKPRRLLSPLLQQRRFGKLTRYSPYWKCRNRPRRWSTGGWHDRRSRNDLWQTTQMLLLLLLLRLLLLPRLLLWLLHRHTWFHRCRTATIYSCCFFFFFFVASTASESVPMFVVVVVRNALDECNREVSPFQELRVGNGSPQPIKAGNFFIFHQFVFFPNQRGFFVQLHQCILVWQQAVGRGIGFVQSTSRSRR